VYERAANLTWGTTDPGHHPITEVRLFRVPEGWNAAAGQLTALSPDGTYQVQVSTDHEAAGRINLVQFTLGDLSADAVWATSPNGSPRVLNRNQFDKQARDGC
jgi:hypothetical protein